MALKNRLLYDLQMKLPVLALLIPHPPIRTEAEVKTEPKQERPESVASGAPSQVSDAKTKPPPDKKPRLG